MKHHSSKRAQNAVEHWQEMAIVTILSTTVVNKSMNIQPLSSLKVIMVLIPQKRVQNSPIKLINILQLDGP